MKCFQMRLVVRVLSFEVPGYSEVEPVKPLNFLCGFSAAFELSFPDRNILTEVKRHQITTSMSC